MDRAIPSVRGTVLAALTLILALSFLAGSGLAVDVPLPDDPDGDDGPGPGGSEPSSGSEGVPSVPTDPVPPDDGDDGDDGDGRDDPTAPVPGEGSSGLPSAVETLPPKDDGPLLSTPDDPVFILIALVIIGVVSAYAPGEVRRMRIEAAHREAMDGRLALAKGEFSSALSAFDRAIEQAHTAYTRRVRIDRPADWALMPDVFYISLWRGRAAALMGLGRQRSAAATSRLADELEIAVSNGH